MITFKTYASSSAGNMYTVDDGDTKLILECGLPWNKIKELLGYKTSSYSGVLATHRHFDHSKGMEGAAKSAMDVYSSQDTFDSLGLKGHRYKPVENRKQFRIGTFSIIGFNTIHDCDGSLGFLLASKGERFLFLTDSAYIEPQFRDLTGIAIECNYCSSILEKNMASGSVPESVGKRIKKTHFSLDNVIAFLKHTDKSKLRQVHLLHISNGNGHSERMKKAVQAIVGCPVIIAAE